MKRKHYLVYQIDDNINNKIYIGVHTTLKINDAYMGSGVGLKNAFKEHGVENFSKTILYNFDNEEDMLNKEAELVNEEFINRNDTYNIILGGGFNTNGFVTVKDENGNYFFVSKNDKRYLSGKLKHMFDGMVTVKNKDGKFLKVKKNDKRYLSGELVPINIGKIITKDKDGNNFRINCKDDRYLSGELVGITKDTITVKNKEGIFFNVDINDDRYLSGEFIAIWKDKKHTKETLKKMRETHNKNGHMQGEKNSQFGTCWIYNEKLKENKKIKKNELNIYSKKGWKKGRKMMF